VANAKSVSSRTASSKKASSKKGRSTTSTPKTATPKAATPKTATPWGPAGVVEQLTVRQQAGERRFSSLVQLLETDRGERLVRFAYSTGGTARRGPVTLRERDVAKLREALAQHPALAEVLGVAPLL
jgi:hypothetical protein